MGGLVVTSIMAILFAIGVGIGRFEKQSELRHKHQRAAGVVASNLATPTASNIPPPPGPRKNIPEKPGCSYASDSICSPYWQETTTCPYEDRDSDDEEDRTQAGQADNPEPESTEAKTKIDPSENTEPEPLNKESFMTEDGWEYAREDDEMLAFEQVRRECDDLLAKLEARWADEKRQIMPIIEKLRSNQEKRTFYVLRKVQEAVSVSGLGGIYSEDGEDGLMPKEEWFSWMRGCAQGMIDDVRSGKLEKELKVLCDIHSAVEASSDDHEFRPRRIHQMIQEKEWLSWIKEATSKTTDIWCDRLCDQPEQWSADRAFCTIHVMLDELDTYWYPEFNLNEDEIWEQLQSVKTTPKDEAAPPPTQPASERPVHEPGSFPLAQQ